MRKDFIFTSESVSEGHPDKVSDRISDMVVDHFIAKDPFARVACETLTTTNKVVLAGEVRGPVEEDKDEIVSKSTRMYQRYWIRTGGLSLAKRGCTVLASWPVS